VSWEVGEAVILYEVSTASARSSMEREALYEVVDANESTIGGGAGK